METIFDHAFANTVKVPPSGIPGWLKSMRESNTKGLARLSSARNTNAVLLLHAGEWLASYPELPGGISPEELADTIGLQGDVFSTFIPLTPHGLAHSNLLIQAEIQQAGMGHRLTGLSGRVESLGAKDEPYLVKLEWHNAAGSILFNGVSDLPHSLYISEGLVLDETGIPDPILKNKDDPSCSITIYSPDQASDAWRELRLRRAFKQTYEILLERFERLAGRALIESFSHIVVNYALENNFEVSISRRQFIVQAYFPSSQAAARHYQKIMDELLDHFSAMIGLRLLATNLRDIHSALPDNSRMILQEHAILPEGYLL